MDWAINSEGNFIQKNKRTNLGSDEILDEPEEEISTSYSDERLGRRVGLGKTMGTNRQQSVGNQLHHINS
jgi:hypothetical protein